MTAGDDVAVNRNDAVIAVAAVNGIAVKRFDGILISLAFVVAFQVLECSVCYIKGTANGDIFIVVAINEIIIRRLDAVSTVAALNGAVVCAYDAVASIAAIDIADVGSKDRILSAAAPDAAVETCYDIVVIRACIDVGMFAGLDAVVPIAAAD